MIWKHLKPTFGKNHPNLLVCCVGVQRGARPWQQFHQGGSTWSTRNPGPGWQGMLYYLDGCNQTRCRLGPCLRMDLAGTEGCQTDSQTVTDTQIVRHSLDQTFNSGWMTKSNVNWLKNQNFKKELPKFQMLVNVVVLSRVQPSQC